MEIPALALIHECKLQPLWDAKTWQSEALLRLLHLCTVLHVSMIGTSGIGYQHGNALACSASLAVKVHRRSSGPAVTPLSHVRTVLAVSKPRSPQPKSPKPRSPLADPAPLRASGRSSPWRKSVRFASSLACPRWSGTRGTNVLGQIKA